MSKIIDTQNKNRVTLGYTYGKLSGNYTIDLEIPMNPQEEKDKKFCAVVSELVELRRNIESINKRMALLSVKEEPKTDSKLEDKVEGWLLYSVLFSTFSAIGSLVLLYK